MRRDTLISAMKRKRLAVGDWVSYEDMGGRRRRPGEIMRVEKNKEGMVTAYRVRFQGEILVLDESKIKKGNNPKVFGL